MNIHEYQAKELLATFGVAIPAGYAALSVEDAGALDVGQIVPAAAVVAGQRPCAGAVEPTRGTTRRPPAR